MVSRTSTPDPLKVSFVVPDVPLIFDTVTVSRDTVGPVVESALGAHRATVNGSRVTMSLAAVGDAVVRTREDGDGNPCDPIYAVEVDLALAVEDEEIGSTRAVLEVYAPEDILLPGSRIAITGPGVLDPEAFADAYALLLEGALSMRQVMGRKSAAALALPLVDELLERYLS